MSQFLVGNARQTRNDQAGAGRMDERIATRTQGCCRKTWLGIFVCVDESHEVRGHCARALSHSSAYASLNKVSNGIVKVVRTGCGDV